MQSQGGMPVAANISSSNKLAGSNVGGRHGQQRFGNPSQAPPPQGPGPTPPLGVGYGMPGGDLSPHAVPSPSPRGPCFANPNAFNSILDNWQGQSQGAMQPQGQFGMPPQGVTPAGIGYGGPYNQCRVFWLLCKCMLTCKQAAHALCGCLLSLAASLPNNPCRRQKT